MTNNDEIKLPDFMMKSRWHDTTPTPAPTRRQSKLTRADKLILIATTAIITAATTFGWAVVMNGAGKLPVLRVHFYVPAEDLD